MGRLLLARSIVVVVKLLLARSIVVVVKLLLLSLTAASCRLFVEAARSGATWHTVVAVLASIVVVLNFTAQVC